MNANLTITDLSKRYGSTVALDGVNLTLRPAIHGLFGRNGAGKSTLLGVIANRLLPDGGAVELDGANVRENESAQSRIYLVNETLPFLLGARISTIFKREERYYGGFDWPFSARMLAAFGIEPGRAYGHLSLGQRMIVRLVAALCVPTDVLLLDEPVLGLDAVNRDLFYRFLLESYGERPRIIVISTHIIDEIAHIVERAAIIDHGRIIDAFDAESVGSRATVLTGESACVGSFVEDCGLQVISRETMGRLATVIVRGPVEAADLPSGIAASALGLQDYVIRVTSGAVGPDMPDISDHQEAGDETGAVSSSKGE
ncbi:ATP-binding cassette domain-containing protein [Bifidobacterium miconisargentati]|uniref:ATP-binding cassette domain-containing protein n=1 Tax=Bifidobacterium miconisargentati TaxID=2834437 RepID=UPI001BDC2F16|nr:ABC transporter ATP-binding protein [Bifidobacterium miconisargentati]MBW3091059.1 ABC transporter ATP-binding protein [Bifidobacterium miconisargentati]